MRYAPPLASLLRDIDPDAFQLLIAPTEIDGVRVTFDIVDGEDQPYADTAGIEDEDLDLFQEMIAVYGEAERRRERVLATADRPLGPEPYVFAKGTGRVVAPLGAQTYIGGSESDVIAFTCPVSIPEDPCAPVTWRVVDAFATEHDGPSVYVVRASTQQVIKHLLYFGFTNYLNRPGLSPLAREAFGMGASS